MRNNALPAGALAVVAGLGTLAGCGSGGDTDAAGSPSASTSPTSPSGSGGTSGPSATATPKSAEPTVPTEVKNPCKLVDRAKVADLLGGEAEPKPSKKFGRSVETCVYSGPGSTGQQATLTLQVGRLDAPFDTTWRQFTRKAGEGAKEQAVRIKGTDDAGLLLEPGTDPVATVMASHDAYLYTVVLLDAGGDPAEVAQDTRDAAQLLARSNRTNVPQPG